MIRLLRFADLKAAGIINSWVMLKRRVKHDNFPPGVMIGKNTRAWDEAEIKAWLKSRPVAGPAPRGIAKAPRGRPRKVKAAASADAPATA